MPLKKFVLYFNADCCIKDKIYRTAYEGIEPEPID